jgi:hypothetical protein
MKKVRIRATPGVTVAARLRGLGYGDPIERLVRIAADGDTPAPVRRSTFLVLQDFVLSKDRALSMLKTLLDAPRPEEIFGSDDLRAISRLERTHP